MMIMLVFDPFNGLIKAEKIWHLHGNVFLPSGEG